MPRPSPAGVVWVDRHLHKNGGSTVREVMLRNEEAGNCVYYGYTQTHEGWARVMDALRSAADGAPAPALCIEAHASQATAEFMSQRVPDLLRLRAHYAARRLPTRVVLSARVRNPLSYYLSFYRWRVAGMQRAGNVIRLSPSRSVVNPLGSTFLEWAPPNLQSTGLLHGDVELFAGLKGGGFPGVRNRTEGRRPHPYYTAHARYGRADHLALLERLSHFDVVAPLEAFDEALLLVADATSLPPLQPEEHRAVAPDPHGMPRGARLRDADLCPDMAACRAHVAAIAPWDLKLYRHVRRAFAARLRRLEPGFARRVDEFRAARAAGGGLCDDGGAPRKPGPRCCCADRVPCFNLSQPAWREPWREPPPCQRGGRALQRLVAGDMPIGMCCTNRRPPR